MTTEEKVNNLMEKFAKIFNREVDTERLTALIDFWGIDKMTDAINYLLITGVWEIKEGCRDNPYGLLYKICKNYNFKH